MKFDVPDALGTGLDIFLSKFDAREGLGLGARRFACDSPVGSDLVLATWIVEYLDSGNGRVGWATRVKESISLDGRSSYGGFWAEVRGRVIGAKMFGSPDRNGGCCDFGLLVRATTIVNKTVVDHRLFHPFYGRVLRFQEPCRRGKHGELGIVWRLVVCSFSTSSSNSPDPLSNGREHQRTHKDTLGPLG